MTNPTSHDYREAARTIHEREGEIEIDMRASVSHGDRGAWVKADVWVPIEKATPRPPQTPPSKTR